MPLVVAAIAPNRLPGVPVSEPEDAEEDMGGDLGVAAQDEDVNQLI